MKYTVKKLKDFKQISGTSLKGYVYADYSTLVEVFGEPAGCYDDYKSDCAWDLVINGTVCTIYNYKDGQNYCGEDGLLVEDITEWHIGGHSRLAEQLVEGAIEQHYKAKTQTA